MKGLLLSGKWKPRSGYPPTKRERDDRRALSAKNIWFEPKLEVAEVAVPAMGDDKVMMKVGACGICGSDICFLDVDEEGYLDYVGHTRLPVVIGHEFAGVVAKVGKNVTRFKEGDLVTAETMNWCGECMPCRSGMFNQCKNLEEIGFTLSGGMGEYLVAKEKYCLNINEFADIYGDRQKAMEVGALVEPLSVAYNGIFTRAGGFRPGGYVAVFAAGPIGLSAVMLAKAAGAAKILVFEFSAPRLELAKKVGATDVFNLADLQKDNRSVSAAILEATGGLGVHMAIECSSFCDKNLPEIAKAMAVGAKVVQLGHNPRATEFFGQYYQKRGATFYGSNGGSGHGNWESVVRMISAGLIDPSRIIAKTFSLDEAIAGFREAKAGTGGKYLVAPNK